MKINWFKSILAGLIGTVLFDLLGLILTGEWWDLPTLLGAKLGVGLVGGVFGHYSNGAAIAVIVGTLYGAIAGYFGGRTDGIMMRIVDILMAIPFMFVLILMLVIFGRSILMLFIGIGLISWLDMSRIARGQTLTLKKQGIRRGRHRHRRTPDDDHPAPYRAEPGWGW